VSARAGHLKAAETLYPGDTELRDTVRRVWDEAGVTVVVSPPNPRSIPSYCRGRAGDCDGNCHVTINELIDTVRIARMSWSR